MMGRLFADMYGYRVSLLLAAYLAVGAVAFAQDAEGLTSYPSDDYLLRGGSVRDKDPILRRSSPVIDRYGQPIPLSGPPAPRRDANPKAAFTSVTSFTAPRKAQISLKKAIRELDKGPRGDLGKAINELKEAVAIYPAYALAWSILGQVRMETGNAEAGEADLMKAIEVDPQYIRPYEPLIRLRMSQNDWAQVDQLADYVLKIAPTEPTILWYKALASFQEADRRDEALSLIDKVQRVEGADAKFPQTHQVLGVIYAERNQFREAATEYRRYLELAPHAESRDAIGRRLDEWEQLGYI